MKKIILTTFTLLCVLITPCWAKDQPFDWVTYSLNLQMWDTHAIDGASTTIVRRAENKLTFKPSTNLNVVVMADPAKTLTPGKDNTWLQDYFTQWKIGNNWKWQVGQFKIPFGEEGPRSSAHLDTIERSQFNLGANKFSDLRELGTMMEYQDQFLLAQFGLFSGDPTNQSVGSTLREGVARIVITPDPHFHIGGSLAGGSRHNVDKPLDQLETTGKSGVEFMWDDKPWNFESEFVSGTINVPTVSGGVITAVTPTTRQGWYAKLRYDVSPDLQAVVREDGLFTNINAPGNGERDVTAGVNYWFQKKPQELLLQVNYVNRVSYSTTPVPSIWRANLELYF